VSVHSSPFAPYAQVAELVDALVSGASGVTLVEVQVLSWAPKPSLAALISVMLVIAVSRVRKRLD
jgi:Flp pilus assembly pilin Flp